MLTHLTTYLAKQSRTTIATAGVILVVFLGGVDFISGYEISISIFYLGPIALVTWLAGRQLGLAVASVSALIWLVADTVSGHVFTHPLIPFWNMLVRLGFFLTVVIILSQLQLAYEEQKQVIQELQESMDKVKILSGLIPICAWCKKVRDDKGYWQQVETFISENSEMTFTHSICQECKEKELDAVLQRKKATTDPG